MHLTNILFVAVALSFDAMAVAAAHAARHRGVSLVKALRTSFFFGFFQLFMPLVGWLIGSSFQRYITSYDHWVSFILLGILGLKMIVGSYKKTEEKNDIHNWRILFLLSIATSIDALVVGVSFAFLTVHIGLAVAIIGATTFVLTLLSVYLGKKIGERWGKKSELVGGAILILIGFKILLTHILA